MIKADAEFSGWKPMFVTLFLGLSQLALGSPEFVNRAMVFHRSEQPVVAELIDAARQGNESEFQKHVAAGAMIKLEDNRTVPFTGGTISSLATRCSAGQAVGLRMLDHSDEVSIYWKCPGETNSPMTKLIFENGKITSAATGPAVVYVVPVSKKGS